LARRLPSTARKDGLSRYIYDNRIGDGAWQAVREFALGMAEVRRRSSRSPCQIA
jgi:hypothetical protein